MPTRRELLLDAAIEVLGSQGIRALTHRAIDAAANMPAGSASNYFRTREALIDAVVDRFTERDQAAWETIAGAVRPSDAASQAAARPSDAASQAAARPSDATSQAAVPPGGAAELAAALTAYVRRATGPDRALTVARYSIFVEAALRPALAQRLAESAGRIREWGAAWLSAAGSTDPGTECATLLDHLDGVLLHHLAFPYPEPALAATLDRAVRSLTTTS